MEGINQKTKEEVLQMTWTATMMVGERVSDFYERCEKGIATWKKGHITEKTWPCEVSGLDDVPEWATQITTFNGQVGQYAGMHPEKGLTVVVI